MNALYGQSQGIRLLEAAFQIAILKRGVYLVRSPLYAGEIHPFAIAAALVQPVAISHRSALAHRGFTTQLPTVVQATTTAAVITPEMRQPALAHREEPVVKATGEDDGYPILASIDSGR